jgi:enolase
MNVINGGAHANNKIDLQEFMLVPLGAPSFREALRYGAEVFHTLKKIIDERGMPTTVGDEGGFAPNLPGNEAALKLLMEAIEKAATRRAPTSRWRSTARRPNITATASTTSSRRREAHALADGRLPCRLVRQVSDHQHRGCDGENDWDGWKLLSDRLGKKVQLVGDDVFVTNTRLLKQGIAKGVANSILIKINQIGTISETFSAITMATRGLHVRRLASLGRDRDSMIADIAVGTNAGQIKTGSLSRSERIAKYNQLLRIEEDLGDAASYPGRGRFFQLR